MPSLNQWLHDLLATGPVKIPEVPSNIAVLVTDASMSGWGAILFLPNGEVHQASAKWSEHELKGNPHINVLELRAARKGFLSFTSFIAGSHVNLYLDNTTAIRTIEKGNSNSFWICQELMRFKLPIPSLSVSYIASAQNPADESSRGKYTSADKQQAFASNNLRRPGGQQLSWVAFTPQTQMRGGEENQMR
jgi:hypothetical protein